MAGELTSCGTRHVLITGASSGIGREMARVFAAKGFVPVLLARRRDKLQQVAHELKAAMGATVIVLPADLAESGTPQEVFDCLAAREIAIEILVNNAGFMVEGDFAHIVPADHFRLLQVNIVALTMMTRLFLAPMLQRAHGRILNVASIAAFAPAPSLACYAASKAYVLSLGEALSEELSGTGVSVTTLCPGFTDTDMVHSSQRGAQLPSVLVSDVTEVARQGVAACWAGAPVHVVGAANAAAASAGRFLPRAVVRAAGGAINRRWPS